MGKRLQQITSLATAGLVSGLILLAGFSLFHDTASSRNVDQDSGREHSEDAGYLSVDSVGLLERSVIDGIPTQIAREIVREHDPIYEKAVKWQIEMEVLRDEFYASSKSSSISSGELREQWNDQLHQEKLLRFDSNGDGEIDEYEAHIMSRPRFVSSMAGQKLPDRFDQNQDMILSSDEELDLEAYYQAEIRRELEPLLRKYDADGNGRLSYTERAVYHSDWIAEPIETQSESSHRQEWLTHRVDFDGDHSLTINDTRIFLRNLSRGSVIADLDKDGFAGIDDFNMFREWSNELRLLIRNSP